MNLPPLVDDIPNEAYQTKNNADIDDYDYNFHVKVQVPEFINHLQVIEEHVHVAFCLELGKEVNDDLQDGGVGPLLQRSCLVYYDEKKRLKKSIGMCLVGSREFFGYLFAIIGEQTDSRPRTALRRTSS